MNFFRPANYFKNVVHLDNDTINRKVMQYASSRGTSNHMPLRVNLANSQTIVNGDVHYPHNAFAYDTITKQ